MSKKKQTWLFKFGFTEQVKHPDTSVNVEAEDDTSWTQDVNWTYIRRSQDVHDVFWTSYVHSIYALCPVGIDDEKASTRHSCKKRFKSQQGLPLHSAWAHPNSIDIDKSCAVSNIEKKIAKNNKW